MNATTIKVNWSDNKVHFALLNGLRTPIANNITQKQPKDMMELDASRTAEEMKDNEQVVWVSEGAVY